MCKLCEQGQPQDHSVSRRDFITAAAATGTVAAASTLLAAQPAAAQGVSAPGRTGADGRRYVIRRGAVLSMDPRSATSPKPTSWSTARRSPRSAAASTRVTPR